MRGWRLAFGLCLVLLLASNTFWVYAFIDQGVTLMYFDTVSEERSRAIQELGALIVKGADTYSKADVLHLLRQAKPDAFIVDSGQVVVFEGIEFRFSDDRLVGVGGGS